MFYDLKKSCIKVAEVPLGEIFLTLLNPLLAFFYFIPITLA